ncbi:MAG: hypothetical protein M0018_05665 [Nitrospiraceae bacterium]|nr:hypothetical protein [Nitrospiraceae bacterium]
MKVGFNTNIPYKGKTYHVQTEDCGLSNPHILTLLYYEGAILASRRTSYEPFIGRPDCSQKILELMNLQHKLMMKELVAGKHTAPSGGGSPADPAGTVGGKPEEKPAEGRDTAQQARCNPVAPASSAQATAPAALEPGKAAGTGGKSKPEEGHKTKGHAGAKGQIKNSLDDVLIDFILRNRQE